MAEQTMQASTFKAQCLRLLDEVAETHRSVVITKHGRPVARLVAFEPDSTTMGTVTLLVDDDDAYFSTGEVWDAQH